MFPNLSLILGGASSGKSALAERMVKSQPGPHRYLATAQALDNEMRLKILKHRADRGSDWQTIEAPLDLDGALAKIPAGGVVLLDCATFWLSNHLLAESNIGTETKALLDALRACRAPVVVVSNEVGQGVVPDNALARKFRDAQGKLNQRLAGAADLAVFVTAGLPQVLKGELPDLGPSGGP